jgi:DNA repair exonuclease SbcCD ATPase subunit
MTKKFKQLIWLGAGNATEPKGLIEQAESSMLVEAREDAFKHLISTFSNYKNVVLYQSVISAQSCEVAFNQYNLPEFSALNKATGLTQLFPGLKLVQQDTVTSKGIVELLSEVNVTGEDNVLVLDIADIGLNLLQKLDGHQLLHCFCQIMIVGSSVALYQDSYNRAELNNFMQEHGFYLVSEDKTDPDLPWLTFASNPLWQKLRQAVEREAELKTQLDAQRQQSAAQAKQLEQREAELKTQLELLNQQLVKQGQQAEQLRQEQALVTKSNKDLHEQLSAVTVAAEKKQAELGACLSGKDAELSALSEQRNKDRTAFTILTEQHDKLKAGLDKAQHMLLAKEQELSKFQTEQVGQLTKLKTELEQVSKHATQRLDKIAQLEKANRQLNETNDQLAKRQRVLEHEMLKAEAQIDIIKELVLR